MFKRKNILTLLLTILTVTVTVPMDYASAATQKNGTSQTSKRKKSRASKNSKKKSSKGTKPSGARKGKKKQNTETSADVKRRQEAAQRDIRQTEQQLRENDAAVKKSLSELGKLEGDIAQSKKRVAEAGHRVATLQKQIGSLQSQISADERSLAMLRAEYLKAVKKMRAKKNGNSTLAFIFSSKSFNEAMRRMRYLRQFSAWRENRSKEISDRVSQLKEKTTRLSQTKTMHDRALATGRKAQNELQAQYNRQDAIVVELKKNGKALQSHLAKKQAEVNVLKNRVASLIAEEHRKAEAERQARERAEVERRAQAEAERRAREEQQAREEQRAREDAERQAREQQIAQETKQKPKKDKKKKKETPAKQNNEVTYAEARKRRPKSQKSSPSATQGRTPATSAAPSKASSATAGTGFEKMKGSLPRPVAGAFRVTSRFGRQSLPDLPNVMYDNPGIDAEVAAGASAQAVYAGKVSGVYMIPGYSTVVIVNHDGYYTVYGNISQAAVKVGDAVKQGQSLGHLAADEDDPSHSSIHFEVWKNRDKLDPLGWIR